MFDLSLLRQPEIVWPVVMLFAWWLAERVQHLISVPRIAVYALVGFLAGPAQLAILPAVEGDAHYWIANFAFGLLLAECGARIHLGWLWANPWLLVTSLAESFCTFVAVYFMASWFSMETGAALVLSALAIATSPATVVRVVNEQRSSGQVTERLLHLAAFNSMLAVLVFKIVIGWEVYRASGSVLSAISSSALVLLASVVLGAACGLLSALLLRQSRRAENAAALVLVLALVLLVSVAFEFKLSAVLAALTFGMVGRQQRLIFGGPRLGFGSVGDILSLFLFLMIAAAMQHTLVWQGLAMGLALLLVRLLAKLLPIALFARASGISLRKGFWLGLASAPMSVFVILVLEQARHLGVTASTALAPLMAAAFFMEIFGPVLLHIALRGARELPPRAETDHAS